MDGDIRDVTHVMRCLKIFFLSSCCLRLIIVLCVHYRRLLEINFYKNKKQSYLNSFIFVESSVVEKFCNQRKGGQDKFFLFSFLGLVTVYSYSIL